MNYNQFYRKKDRIKREYTPEEKRNLKKVALTCAAFMLLGMVTGLIILFLFMR